MGIFAPPFPKMIPKSHCMRTVDKQMQKCFCFVFAVNLQSLYGGQFTLSTQLINPRFCITGTAVLLKA